ncbi:glycosyltransferase family 4 protein [Flavobacterium sp. N3904]|uniref:glycosyltransferase family 4 protein n=1 Tax=Flavobacterium sp. N3904 TaxID=2986835 RepID=UPI0022240F59|nr:glycosyltransferase family 1 protein [Flavobacterium sp. N3904]
MSKNILFYIPTIDQGSGGIRQYSFNMLKMISENDTGEFNFFIYHKRNDKMFLEIIEKKANFKLIPTHFIAKTLIKGYNLLGKVISFLTFEKIIFKKEFYDFLIKKHEIQIVHCPYQFIPKTKKAKLITTMHDVQEIHFPEFFSEDELKNRAVNYPDYMERADTIIVSYNHIKEDLVNFFKINPLKIKTLLIGLNDLWIAEYFNKGIKFDFKTDFESYLLYPANAWKHKNHIKLLEAINFLKNQNKIINFLFTGDFTSDHGLFLINKIEEFELQNQIILKGIVSQDELYSIYQNATGVVVPTLYEAGSYPLYESIYIEKPVVCSNVTSLPETIGDNKFVFNPLDKIDIADKVEKLYFDEDYRNVSRLNAIKMKNELKSNNSIKTIYSVYRNL